MPNNMMSFLTKIFLYLLNITFLFKRFFFFFFILINLKSIKKGNLNVILSCLKKLVFLGSKLYVKAFIFFFNLFIYWPIMFFKAIFVSLHSVLRFSLFLIGFGLLFLLLYKYLVDLKYLAYLNIFVEVKKGGEVVQLYGVFDPLLQYNLDSPFYDYFEFVNLHFAFLRYINAQDTFFPYYDQKEGNPNFLLHKAVFSDFIRSRYLLHNTQAVDWYYATSMYAKGWLNHEDFHLAFNKLFVIKLLAYTKTVVFFFFFNICPSDIVFLKLKYMILDTFILNKVFEDFNLLNSFFLNFFKISLVIFPDSFLLGLGYYYKYILLVVLEDFTDHLSNFFFKFYKVYQQKVTNNVAKKKLLHLSTDTNDVPYIRKTLYKFLLPLKEAYTPRTFWVSGGLRQYSNIIESSPFIEERYDLYHITGFNNPKSNELYITVSGPGYDPEIRSDLQVRPYMLATWNSWSKLNVSQDFFSKSLYSRLSQRAGSFFPGFSNKNVDAASTFFAGDKSIQAKHLPKIVSWNFKGPYAFSSLRVNYVSNLSSIDNTTALRIEDFNSPFFRVEIEEGYRSYDHYDVFPKMFEALNYIHRRNVTVARSRYKKLLSNFIGDEDASAFNFHDMVHPYLYIRRSYVDPFRTILLQGFSVEGDFYFGSENYVQDIVPQRFFFEAASHLSEFRTLVSDISFTKEVLCEPLSIPLGEGVSKIYYAPVYRSYAPLEFLTDPVNNEPLLNIDMNIAGSENGVNFYKLWVDSLLTSTMLSVEMGKGKLLFESKIPKYYYNGHILKYYNLRARNTLAFFSECVYLLLSFHLTLLSNVYQFLSNFYLIIILLFLLLRTFFFLYIIELKNKQKILYNDVSRMGILFDKKRMSVFHYRSTYETWGFSDLFKINYMKILYTAFPRILVFKFLNKFLLAFLEITFLCLQGVVLLLSFVFSFGLWTFEFLLFRISISAIELRNKIFFYFWSLFNTFYLLYSFFFFKGWFLSVSYLTYSFLFFISKFIFALLKLIFIFFIISNVFYILNLFNAIYNIDFISYCSTYLSLFIIFFLFFIFSFLSNFVRESFVLPKFKDIIPYSEDDLFTLIDDDFDEIEAESDEPDDDEEDFYDYKDYSFSFTSSDDLSVTSEGVMATDILRSSFYEADAAFFRSYYFQKFNLKRRLDRENSAKDYFASLISFGTLKKTIILLRRVFSLHDLFFVGRFYRPFYQWVAHNVLYLILGLYWIQEERLKLVLRNYLLRLLIGYTFYSFEDVDDLEDCNAFSIDFLDIRSSFYKSLQVDPYHTKAVLGQSVDVEEEFFSEGAWLDQFMYSRVFDVDLTDFNPIIMNKSKHLQLSLYSQSRLDFFEEDILDTNSNKFRFFFFNTYSKAPSYLRFKNLFPIMGRFLNVPFFYYPTYPNDIFIDYEIGLNVEYEQFYRRSYLGFQLRTCFFKENSFFFVKIMNPLESFDNKYKSILFSNVDFYVNLLKLENFPNLTKKEFERVLFFFNCTEQEWDSMYVQKDTFIKPYLAIELPVFLFAAFLYYSKENRLKFFWSFKTRLHNNNLTTAKFTIEQLSLKYLNGIESSLLSTKFFNDVLHYPLLLIDKFILIFSVPGFIHENAWRFYQEFFVLLYLLGNFVDFIFESFIPISPKSVVCIASFSFSSIVDFLVYFEIFIIRSIFGFFFYDLLFFTLKIYNLILEYCLGFF